TDDVAPADIDRLGSPLEIAPPKTLVLDQPKRSAGDRGGETATGRRRHGVLVAAIFVAAAVAISSVVSRTSPSPQVSAPSNVVTPPPTVRARTSLPAIGVLPPART